ncbi:MAG: DUF2339 domain-containing protein [Novosphingobium sp.]|nr:DUF2339 domain-containing protein [Novosphingobium sp.]
MKLWGAVWGALIGWMVVPDFSPAGLIAGALAGLVAGVWLGNEVKNRATAMVREAVSELNEEMHAAIARRVDERLAGTGIAPVPPPQPIAATAQPSRAPAPASAAEALLPSQPLASRPVAPPISREPESEAPRGPTLAEQGFAAVRDWFLGGNTIVRVGLVILFVGLSFLAKLAVDAGLFPIEIRLALVAAAGAALLGVGFNRREKKPQFGRSLQGAGVAVLYLTVFASARVFGLMPPLAAFGLMAVFCALGVALALLQNSRGLALGSFAGGFAVPILLGGQSPTPLPLFAYFTILNVAILVIAGRRSWRPLNLLGFFATFGMATFWGLASYDPRHYLLCQVFLAASVLIYLATALLYAHNTPGKLGNAADATLLFGPAVAGFGLQAGLVRDMNFGAAFSALAFGAVYVALAAFTLLKRRDEMRLLSECLIAIGVGFVTLAIPLALEVRWTSAAWVLEGAGAFWIGARQARWMPRVFGLGLIALAALILLSTLRENISAIPLANTGFVRALMIALPLLLVSWWLRGAPLAHSGSSLARKWEPFESALAKPVFFAGFGFACLALGLELTRQHPPAITTEFAAPVLAFDLQPLTIALGVLVLMWLFDRFGAAKDWAVARWPGRASLPMLAVALVVQLANGRHVLFLPDAVLWVAALAIHFDILWRSEAGPAGDRARNWRTIAHFGGVWLLTAMLADCLQFGVDRAELWDTSWAGVVFLVAATAVLALLTRWAGRAATGVQALGWPLAPHHRAYWWTAALPLAVLVYGGAFATALIASGVTDPLPYVPLLNPVDLAVLLTLAVLLLWRRMLAAADEPPPLARMIAGNEGMVALAALAFAAVNGAWLRTAHHWLDVAYEPASLGASPVVQTGLAIIWTLLAMGLMLLAARKALRAVWIAGAGLLGLVVLKLLFVDMSSAEGWQRIVTFIGVGVLMLVIGYFVPLPPRRAEEPSSREAQEKPA